MNKSIPDGRELELINNYTLSPVEANDIFRFAVVLCDNEIDRDCERFGIEALEKAAELFKGKTGISDHSCSAKDQSARIFDTQVITDRERTTSAGEPYTYVKAFAYMPRTEKNAALIEEIETGIRKETSVGLSVKNKICSVCGEDIRHCSHVKGRLYDGRMCHAVLTEPDDAYEWSFVAVPAQKAAGVTKSCETTGIIKKFIETGSVTEKEKSALCADMGGLLRLAAEGEEYRLSLLRESVKKCCSLFPGTESAFFEELLENAGVNKLLKLCSALDRPRTAVSAPQLIPSGNGGRTSDSGFKI